MNCCDYDCTRAPNCPAGSKDSMPYEFWPGSIVATRLLAGEQLPELEPYEFGPGRFLLNTANSDGSDPDEDTDESILTPGRVLVGAGVFLFSVVAIAMTLLHFYR